MRETLARHDAVLVLGTNAFRLYLLDEEGPPVREGTRVAVITEDPEEAHRSQCELALVAPVADVCAALATLVRARDAAAAPARRRPAAPLPPAPGEPLSPAHVLAALAQRLPANAIVVEESPSSRPELLERLPFRTPGCLFSPANGALGFAMPGAVGLKLALPDRAVVAVIGDGSAMYAIQSVWSAARYGAGVILIVMANGGYEAMDSQARARDGAAPWPRFGDVDLGAIAGGFGCEAVRVDTYDKLLATFDDIFAGLTDRTTPCWSKWLSASSESRGDVMDELGGLREGEVLWTPPADLRETTEIGRFMGWLEDRARPALRRLRRAVEVVGRRSGGILGRGRGVLRASLPHAPRARARRSDDARRPLVRRR